LLTLSRQWHRHLQGDNHTPSLQIAGIKKSLDACTAIFDVACHTVFPSISTSATWKVAGAVSLHPWAIDIVELSQSTGISVQKIIEILDESRYLFGVKSFGKANSVNVFIKPESQQFLLDEARSRDFYFSYRSNTILVFQSKILHCMESERYVMISIQAS